MTFPLPFTLLHFVPFINANRAPNRFSVLLMLSLAVLAGYGVARLLATVTTGRREDGAGRARPISAVSVPSVAISVFLAGLIILEHLAVPLPMTDSSSGCIDTSAPGILRFCSLPLGWRDSFGFWAANDEPAVLRREHGKRASGKAAAPAFKMNTSGVFHYSGRYGSGNVPGCIAGTGCGCLSTSGRSDDPLRCALRRDHRQFRAAILPGHLATNRAVCTGGLPLEEQLSGRQMATGCTACTRPVSPLPLNLGTPGNEPYLGRVDIRSDEAYGATANWIPMMPQAISSARRNKT